MKRSLYRTKSLMVKIAKFPNLVEQNRLVATLEATTDLVALTDNQKQLSYLNHAGRQLLGLAETEDISNLKLEDLYPEWTRCLVLNEGLQIAVAQGVWQGETVLHTRYGQEIPISQVIIAHKTSTGEIDYFSTIARDISKHKMIEHALQLFAKVFESTQEGIMITDANVRIQAVNPAFTAVTGYESAEMIGKNPKLLQSGRQNAEFYKNFWRELKLTGKWQGEIWNRRKNGEIYPEWLSVNAIKDNKGTITNYVGIFSDITSIKLTENRLAHLAKCDPLTGLPNRLLFYDRLKQALVQADRNAEVVAIMFLDLDKFKPINDTLGHRIGDFLLQAVAERLVGSVREGDTVARMGGDEFTLILVGITQKEWVIKVAEKILNVLSQPFVLEGHKFYISASLGISLYPADGDDLEVLVRNADMAMYAAKKQGGNGYKFYPESQPTNLHWRQ